LADPARVRVLRRARNTEFVTRRKDGQVVQINLLEVDDESVVRSRTGNAQSYSFRQHTAEIPRGLWQLKELSADTAHMFHQVQTDCLTA
jgi:hypothetical protein